MRALLQRVSWANVVVSGSEVGSVEQGLLIFLGIRKGDTQSAADYLAEKIAHLRIFEDEAGKMNLDCKQSEGNALVVSQFTLYADTRKGRRPAFTDAEEPEKAKTLYEYFCEQLRQKGIPTETGQFAAHMLVSLQNDGPVTILIDSP